jgi:hypothetical protein
MISQITCISSFLSKKKLKEKKNHVLVLQSKEKSKIGNM